MQTANIIPEWDTLAEALKVGLGYSDATLKRTRYTYNVFVRDYCDTKRGDARNVIKQGIARTGDAYESEMISKDKLLRIRRLAFRMLQLIETGHITWKCAPLYGKKYGNDANETLLRAFVASEQKESRHAESIITRDENIIRHAESIITRDENIIRQYILYAEKNEISILEADAQNMLDFLSHMKKLRPAGLHSTASALKHFYGYLIENGNAQPNILAAIKAWDTPHKRIYGILTDGEKEKLLDAADGDSDIGKRDKAILMLAMDCGLRSSDLCNLKLRDIDWYSASISIIQKKTGKQVSIPFSERTGNALADYILNARGTSSLPYVFLKKSYGDSSLTSSLLCQRLKKLMLRAGIIRPASEKINMHTFRRSLGTSLIDSGESLEMVAQILGHKDIEATKRYISVSEQMLRSCPMHMPEINERAESNE